jgi:hypothetical protein
MIGVMRALWLIVVAACAHTGPPALANTATAAAPVFTTTCYRSATHPGVLIRIVDPSRHVIRGHEIGSMLNTGELVLNVDGDRISALTPHVRVTGRLVGPAWRWTSWSMRYSFDKGGVSAVDAVLTTNGLLETWHLKLRPDTAEFEHLEHYKTIPCPATAGS